MTDPISFSDFDADKLEADFNAHVAKLEQAIEASKLSAEGVAARRHLVLAAHGLKQDGEIWKAIEALTLASDDLEGFPRRIYGPGDE